MILYLKVPPQIEKLPGSVKDFESGSHKVALNNHIFKKIFVLISSQDVVVNNTAVQVPYVKEIVNRASSFLFDTVCPGSLVQFLNSEYNKKTKRASWTYSVHVHFVLFVKKANQR